MRNQKVIFFGTPYYSALVLDKLHKHLKKSDSKIVAVVTRPPKPVGREKIMTYSDVDKWAYGKKIKIIRDPASVIDVEADLGVIASYGKIITKNVIDHFPRGIINIHPSVLPLFRGASPVQSTIASGMEETGVTFFLLDEKMDHGPILSKFAEGINPDDTSQLLRDRLFDRATQALPGLIDAYLKGKITPKVQRHNLATYTKTIKRDDGFIDWKHLVATTEGKSLDENLPVRFIEDFEQIVTPESVYNLFRALQPWPGMWTKCKIRDTEKRLKITDAKLDEGKFVPISVQLEGKNKVLWSQFSSVYLKTT